MYKALGKSDLKEQLVHFAPLVKKLAHQMKARLPQSVEVDDLIQAGMIGLLDGLQRFPEHPVTTGRWFDMPDFHSAFPCC